MLTRIGHLVGYAEDGAVTDVAALFDRVPVGWSVVAYGGRRYGATKTVGVGGRSLTVFAEELGGSDTISANLYLTSREPAFRPCEMPAEKVVAFLAGLEVLPPESA